MAKKMKKLFAMLLTVCMVMSLLSIGASAEGEGTEPEGNFTCAGIHVHNADCYTLTAEGCTIAKDLNCSEHAAHDENCYVPVEHGESCYTVIPESKTLTCQVEGCEHTDDCYTVIPESKTLTCTETHRQLVCEVELHVHDEEACYVEHSHVDSCYKSVLVCELDEHPAHTAACLSETGKGKVDAVIKQMTDAPELQDMQDARNGRFQDKTDYPADQAAAEYADYIADCFAKREAALKAYQNMPAELKPFVPEELVNKLTNGLPTDFKKPASREIAAGEDGYNFMSVYVPCYEMSGHMISGDGGASNDIPQTLMMVDASKDYTWTMDGPYVSGVSNYEVLYCCDAETGYDGGIYYMRKNLEDSPYYNEGAARHIRAIVMNSYPYVTLKEMEAKLPAQFKGLTRAEAIAAVQTAIWSYSNDAKLAYSQTFDVATNSQWGGNVHDYTNEMFDWWNVGKRKFYVARNAEGTGAGDRIDALVDYLTNLKPTKPADNAIVITSMEVVGDPVPVFGSNDEYEVLLKVVLNSGGSDAKDTLMLTATAGSSSSAVTAEVNEGQTEYYMLVSAKSGDTISVELSGTQKLPRGVYFYEAKPVVDAEGNVITAARDVSQNLVGVAMGDNPVSFTVSKLFTSDLELTDAAELFVQKVDQWGAPLTGAEFTLYVDVDGDSVMDPAKTYAVDENGSLGIANLIPGVVYELKETKVPTGYSGIEGAARFEVVMAGEEAVVRMGSVPFGMTYAVDAEGLLVLSVTNTQVYSGGGDNPPSGGDTPPSGGDTPPSGDDLVDIGEGDVPLTGLPEEGVEIGEEDVPLADLPEDDLADLLDEEVPLAMAPATGDVSAIWMALSALSGAGLFLTRKKRDEE